MTTSRIHLGLLDADHRRRAATWRRLRPLRPNTARRPRTTSEPPSPTI